MHFVLTLVAAVAIAGASPGQESRPLSDVERKHSVTEGALRASALWRSERGLERSARQLLEIAKAVDAAGAPRAAALVPDGGAPLEFLLAESPNQLGKQGGRRGVRVQWDPDFRGTGSPAVAVAPRLNDRVMFGAGLPPATRRLAALAVARRLAPEPTDAVPAWLVAGRSALRAQRGLEALGHARAIAVEPWTASGLGDLKVALSATGAEERPGALLELASSGGQELELFDPLQPMRQTAPGAARMLMALVREDAGAKGLTHGELARLAAERLEGLVPRWKVEGGAVAGCPAGWMATASRAADALVLEAEPAALATFRLEATVVIFANDPKLPGQADIVLGDEAGDRLLLAINTREGIYLFRRAGPEQPYEIVAELNKVKVAPFTKVEVRVDYDGEVVQVQVGPSKMAPVRLADRTLDGRVGFGAHAGSTVFFEQFKRGELGQD